MHEIGTAVQQAGSDRKEKNTSGLGTSNGSGPSYMRGMERRGCCAVLRCSSYTRAAC